MTLLITTFQVPISSSQTNLDRSSGSNRTVIPTEWSTDWKIVYGLKSVKTQRNLSRILPSNWLLVWLTEKVAISWIGSTLLSLDLICWRGISKAKKYWEPFSGSASGWESFLDDPSTNWLIIFIFHLPHFNHFLWLFPNSKWELIPVCENTWIMKSPIYPNSSLNIIIGNVVIINLRIIFHQWSHIFPK